jgi:integrase
MRGDGRLYRKPNSSVWHCEYYLRGKQFRQTTGEADQKKAQKFLKNKLKEVHADEIGARPFVGPQQQRITVAELLDALGEDYKLRGKDNAQFKAHLKPIRAHFGDWRAVNITSEAVDKFITARLDTETGRVDRNPDSPTFGHPLKYAKATVNRSTQILGQAFALAVQRGRLATAPHVRHLSESGNTRLGFFGDTEFRNVESNLPKYLQDYARFAYRTGWRKSEVASLRWSDVDGDLIRLRGENAKNDNPRSVVCDSELAELMERRKAARAVKTKTGVVLSDLVFHHDGEPIVDYRKAWATACKMAGCTGKLFHDFRRTAVRNMVRAGTPEGVAMKISGHKTRSMFDRYNITSEADLRDAMQRTQTYLVSAAAEELKRQPVAIAKGVQ